MSSSCESISHAVHTDRAKQRRTVSLSQDSQASGETLDSCRTVHTAGVLDPELHVTLMTHSEARENLSVMQDYSPAYVVLYDADITLIRAVEAHQSMLPAAASPVKVYFILYG